METSGSLPKRMGVRGYFPVNRRARLYVSHLWDQLQLPQHCATRRTWAAAWAIARCANASIWRRATPARRLLTRAATRRIVV